jgi:hypothetical protein
MLAEEIHELRRDFNDFRVEVAQKMESLNEIRRDFNEFRGEVAQKLDALTGFRVEVVQKLDALTDFRVDVVRKLDGITDFRVEVVQKLEALTVRVSDMLSVTRWTIGILTPILVRLIGSAFALTWYVAKLDSRVGQLETSVHPKDAAKVPPQPVAPKPAP